MKPVNILVIVLAALVLTAAGALVLALAAVPAQLAHLQALVADVEAGLAQDGALRPALAALGSLLFAAGVALVWGNLSTRRWERIVVLRNPLGEVMVSLTALEDLGRLIKAEVAGVRDLKLRVSASRRGLQATARVTLVGDVDIPAVTEAVQAAIRRRLQMVVGEDQDIRPRVMVAKLQVRDPAEVEEILEARPRLRRPPRP